MKIKKKVKKFEGYVGDIIEIEWIDSQEKHGWRYFVAEDSVAGDEDELTCSSVGYLLADKPHSIVMCHSLSEPENIVDGLVSGMIEIPKCSIINIRKIES